MKLLVTGVLGQLGFDVVKEAERRNFAALPTDFLPSTEFENYTQLDITDNSAVSDAIFSLKPDAVVHCAAWTAVDLAEERETECRAVNVEGTKNIAQACGKIGAKMIYVSTDYVFSGEGTEPWQADSKDFVPQNVYGRSKLDGELAVANTLDNFFVVRTAWAFGIHGNNFVKTMLELGKTHESLRVVCDQIGTPTYTRDLARLLVDMTETDKYGFYHATNEGGFISWADFAREIFRLAECDTEVVPVTTEEYGLSKAKRPKNSRLDKSKLESAGFERLENWQKALERHYV